MDRQEIRERARFFCSDELQYAIARDDKVDTEAVRERATMRLLREILTDSERYELARGLVDSVYKRAEREYVVDLSVQQLGFRSTIKVDDNTLVPTTKARYRDWLAFDQIREHVFQAHAEKRAREREAIADILERLQGHEDATTLDVCPDLFGEVAA